jgi:hypothetical protein
MGAWALGGGRLEKLFDLSCTIARLSPTCYMTMRVEYWGYVWVSFALMDRTFFGSVDLPRIWCATTESQFKAMASALLGSGKKECCLNMRGLSFGICQGHPKLNESAASSRRMPTCATWLRWSRF